MYILKLCSQNNLHKSAGIILQINIKLTLTESKLTCKLEQTLFYRPHIARTAYTISHVCSYKSIRGHNRELCPHMACFCIKIKQIKRLNGNSLHFSSFKGAQQTSPDTSQRSFSSLVSFNELKQ
jgi:hypothetical protein